MKRSLPRRLRSKTFASRALSDPPFAGVRFFRMVARGFELSANEGRDPKLETRMASETTFWLVMTNI